VARIGIREGRNGPAEEALRGAERVDERAEQLEAVLALVLENVDEGAADFARGLSSRA